MNFIPIELSRDYPKLLTWWAGHHSQAVPLIFLRRGWIAEEGGVEIAASFLYVVEKNVGIIEWTTTNPRCAFSRSLVEAVKGLYSYLESVAKQEGCLAMFSFVKPKSSEERIMSRMGYSTSDIDCGHRLYAKPIVGPFAGIEGGIISCP